MILLFFISLIHFFSCAYRTIWGLCTFLAIRILVPECARITDSLSLNSLCILVLLLFTLRDFLTEGRLNIIKKSLLNLYLSFFCMFFVLLLLSDFQNFSFQLGRLMQFLLTDIIPAILASIIIQKKQDVKLIINTLIVASLICCSYGVYTFFEMNNPYVDYFLYQNKSFQGNSLDFSDISRGLSGYTSGTFISTNAFGYFLPITFVMLLYKEHIQHNCANIIVLILISICTIMTTKRSAIISYCSIWIFLFLFSKKKTKWKYFSYISIIVLIVIMLIMYIPFFGNIRPLIESSIFFWNDNLADKNDIGGSSFMMRYGQIYYSFVEVKNNILFGKGFGWTTYYLSKNTYHPTLFGFENIITEAIVTMGVCGLFVWSFIFYKSYRYSSFHEKDKSMYKIFTLIQIVIAIATGFSYFIFYGIYIAILNKFYLLKRSE
jgi:hypothetical protein